MADVRFLLQLCQVKQFRRQYFIYAAGDAGNLCRLCQPAVLEKHGGRLPVGKVLSTAHLEKDAVFLQGYVDGPAVR